METLKKGFEKTGVIVLYLKINRKIYNEMDIKWYLFACLYTTPKK